MHYKHSQRIKLKILVSALEPSSNLHLGSLKQYFPNDVEFVGIFDASFGKPIVDLSQNAIMGFVDAIKKLPFFFKLKSQMVELSKSCDKVLLMDSSGFNLPLAKAIKKANPKIEIIYYILPQAWAWKQKRVVALDKYCDKLLSIIPFEKRIYPNPQKVEFVGHPLLDQIKNIKNEFTHSNTIAFMPGSRKSEIKSLMPVFREVCNELKNKNFLLVVPPKFSDDFISEIYGDIHQFEISRNTHEALLQAEYAFICSGTATLEAALIGTPFTLCYIAKKFDYFIGSIFVKLNFIGLANIFFEKMGRAKLHDEFIQENVTAKNLIQSYKNCDLNNFNKNCKDLRVYLQSGSAENASKIIMGN